MKLGPTFVGFFSLPISISRILNLRKSLNSKKRIILLSTKGKIAHTDFTFQKDDLLMVGRESAGVPTEIHDQVDEVVIIPISKSSRSLNVSAAAAIALSEAMRQLKI